MSNEIEKSPDIGRKYFTQNNKDGILLDDFPFTVENLLTEHYYDDPMNPVILGLRTMVRAPDNLSWSVIGSNIVVNGIGNSKVVLPLGDYEIVANPK